MKRFSSLIYDLTTLFELKSSYCTRHFAHTMLNVMSEMLVFVKYRKENVLERGELHCENAKTTKIFRFICQWLRIFHRKLRRPTRTRLLKLKDYEFLFILIKNVKIRSLPLRQLVLCLIFRLAVF